MYFHNRKVHEGVKFRCEECGKQFGRKSTRTAHFKVVHEEKKPYKCPKCGILFGWQGHFTSHMKTVREEVKFQCEECGKQFRWKTSMAEHVRRSHTSVTSVELRLVINLLSPVT